MDATYKTNKYSIPLLDITGISSTFSSLTGQLMGHTGLQAEVWLGSPRADSSSASIIMIEQVHIVLLSMINKFYSIINFTDSVFIHVLTFFTRIPHFQISTDSLIFTKSVEIYF